MYSNGGYARLADIFFLGFQEQMAEDFEILKVKLGIPEHAVLPTDDVDAHRNPAAGIYAKLSGSFWGRMPIVSAKMRQR